MVKNVRIFNMIHLAPRKFYTVSNKFVVLETRYSVLKKKLQKHFMFYVIPNIFLIVQM